MERAAARRGVRDRAIVAVLLYAGARVEECERLDAQDVTLTARTGHIRLLGKGDEVRTVPLPPVAREHLAAWLGERGTHDGPMWTGQRGRLTISGITQVVLAVGDDAGIPGLRPHRLRHTYATVSAKAAPTPPRSKHSSARPPSRPPHGTSAQAVPNGPPSSTASSSNPTKSPHRNGWTAITPPDRTH
ncbi:phage integrase family protein [Kribbella orskensis]|uniref:Phage integrase family protein n=1 Tax=Kribbella orskensis TaxID=2512216 RepID=A0ABY2B6S5_9ACTN|nr:MULTISPECIES: tyrosine-type recombinase/integrase [Kribbella]TCN29268.1 phage integrase family protein [Kribbella sp. VKM Ac-2500]TCO09547.1 phage integrase family protein [Kribbella orskensis]